MLALALHLILTAPSSLSVEDANLDAAFAETGVMGVLEEERELFQTASKTAVTLDETPAILSVLTRDDIRRLGLRTLAEALPLVPGVNVSLNNVGELRFNFRGRNNLESEGVKILIDGHSLNEPSTSGATRIFDTYPLQNIERIEVIRGPGSAIYGANAFTGVINLVTRKTAKMSYEVTGQADSLATGAVGIQANQDLGSAHVSGYASVQSTQGSRATIEQDRLTGTVEGAQSLAPGPANTNSRRADGLLRLDSKYVDVMAGASARGRGDYAGVEFALSGSQNATPAPELGYWQLFADVQIKPGTFLQRITPTLRLYTDLFNQSETAQLTPAPYRNSRDLDGDGNSEVWPTGRQRKRFGRQLSIGGEAAASFVLFAGNTLSAGYVYELQRQFDISQAANFDIETGAAIAYRQQAPYTEPTYTREVIAGYLEDHWKLFDIAALTAGLRTDYYRDFGYAFSPRAAFVVQPLEGFHLKALYGRAFRAPSFGELFSRTQTDVIGNPTLKPELLNTVEGQVTFRRKNPFKETRAIPIVSKLLLQGAYYWTKIDQAIAVGAQVGGSGPQRLQNLGSVILHGAEIEMRWAFVERVGVYANASLRRALDAQTGQRLASVSDVLANFGLNVSPLPWLTIDSGVVFESERGREPGDNPVRSNGQLTDPSRLAHIPAIYDLRAAVTMRDFNVGPLQLDVSVIGRNLLNQKQLDPSPLYTAPGSLTIPTDYPRPGIYVGAMLTVRFTRDSKSNSGETTPSP